MLATTVLLLLVGWLAYTIVLALRSATPPDESHRATSGPVRLAATVERHTTRPQPQITLPQARLRGVVER